MYKHCTLFLATLNAVSLFNVFSQESSVLKFTSLSTLIKKVSLRLLKLTLFVVGSTGEMSNQIWDDLVEIYKVAKKLGI